MLPPSSNLGSSRDRDDIAVPAHDVLVARKFRIIDVLDRIVAGRGANSSQLPLVLAIHREPLENGVGAGGGRKREKLKNLHLDQLSWLRDLTDGW